MNKANAANTPDQASNPTPVNAPAVNDAAPSVTDESTAKRQKEAAEAHEASPDQPQVSAR